MILGLNTTEEVKVFRCSEHAPDEEDGVPIIETGSLVIEKAGKKMMLSIAYFNMTAVQALLTLTIYLQNHLSWMPYLSLVLIFIFIILFACGPGATTTSLPADIFDQSFKAAGLTVSSTMMWMCLFLVGMLFPLMVESLDYFSFLIFLVFCLTGGLFVWFNVPETKNRTVLQITEEFKKMHSKTNTAQS